MTLTLYENFRAVFYTPFYAAHALGAYADEGLDVRLSTSPDPTANADALRSGTVDVSWGGPMRVMLDHDRNPNSDIVCFCEVAARDPFYILGPIPAPDFQLNALRDVTLATVSEVPTPWVCLQDDLRRVGLDPERLQRITDRKMAENADALRRREAAAIQVFEPFVEQLLAEGAGHIWYAAAGRGACSYTSFYARRRTVETRMDEMRGMTRAIYRMQKWLHRSTPQQIAETVAGFFPDLPQETLAGAIARYLANGVWGRTPLLSRAGFERLGAAMVSGRMLKAPPSYEACVDTRLAESVIAEDLPTLC